MLDSNSFFFEVDDIDLFTNESNQEESNIQFIDKSFCLSKEEGMAATDDRDLNNLTSFTETEKIVPEEKKNNMTISDELNETSFTVKSNDDDDDETNNESHSKRLVDFSINVIHPPNPSDIFNIKKVNRKTKRKKKKLRKNDADTMRRKIKPYYHKYILEVLNQKIRKKKYFKKKLKKLLKMNNHITSTVSIELNKSLINKKIGNILKTEPISSKYKSFDKENNLKIITLLEEIDDKEINEILNMTYGDMYYDFLLSENYKSLLGKIKDKDGNEYMTRFNDVSQELIYYFSLTDPKKDKNKAI